MNWSIHPAAPDTVRLLSEALCVHPITSQILINRGYKTPEAAKRFIEPDLSQLPDPFLFPDMERAVQRILAAIRAGEKIALYGDYDVDGITGVALLARFFRVVGSDPISFIPSRLDEGYGLHIPAIEKLKAQGVSLIITVDCGTRSIAEVAHAEKLGIDVIVTDHHEGADAKVDHILLNPKHPDVRLVDSEIAGCAVAFLLVMALRKRLREEGIFENGEPNLKEHLDLVALGTIADVVPLTGINRVFAKYGLEIARSSAKPGIRALIEACGLEGLPIKAGNVAFRLAPRLNAAGRLGDALPSLELLTTDDPDRALAIAGMLGTFNSDRQRLEEKALQDAVEIIEQDGLNTRPALVVAGEDWHAGVIGIVASKLVERYLLPAIVISSDGAKGKGSARSVAGLNIVKALERCGHMLERYGGHAQAAGLQIKTSQIGAFREHFELCCAELACGITKPATFVDAAVTGSDISVQLVHEIERLEPFGFGNPEPLLCINEMRIADSRIVGNNHLKMRLYDQRTKTSFDAIGFGLGGTQCGVGETVSVIFTPQINEWNGVTSVQLKLREIECLK